jgi:hypothetical protein
MCTFHEQSMPINVVFLVFECLCCMSSKFLGYFVLLLCHYHFLGENTDIIHNILTIHTDTIHHSYRCQLVLFFFRISSHEGKIVEAHVTTMQLNYAMEIALSLKL